MDADLDAREALYRHIARQPGLPAGARAQLIERAERLSLGGYRAEPQTRSPAWSFLFRGDGEGCKGAASR